MFNSTNPFDEETSLHVADPDHHCEMMSDVEIPNTFFCRANRLLVLLGPSQRPATSQSHLQVRQAYLCLALYSCVANGLPRGKLPFASFNKTAWNIDDPLTQGWVDPLRPAIGPSYPEGHLSAAPSLVIHSSI